MKQKGFAWVAAASFLTAIPQQANAETVQAISSNRSPILGGAYQSDKEMLVSGACITGKMLNTGSPRSTFSFDTQISEREASSKLGLSAGGRTRFGAYKASAEATFMKNAVSTDKSISAIWLSEYQLPTSKIIDPTLSDVGRSVQANPLRWAETCGDEFVDEIVRGARLFFSIRIDFATAEQKQEFTAKFSVSGPLASAKASMEQATSQFSRNVRITVSAYQFGGDVSKVTGIFSDEPARRRKFVECTLGDFAGCADVVDQALSYAASPTTGFPSQLGLGQEPGGAILEYRTAKYSAAGLYLDEYPYLTEMTKQARDRLHVMFEEQFGLSLIADRLKEMRLVGAQLSRVDTEAKRIERNLDAILAASETCYSRPLDCRDAVNALQLETVDQTAFDLPPMAKASFRVWTAADGLWSRQRSVAEMYRCQPGRDGSGAFCLTSSIGELQSVGSSASTVLLVEGLGLDEADLYFENELVGTYALTFSERSFASKFGPGWAMLVIESTRLNPGWQDIDLHQVRRGLTEKMPRADGVFYVIVRDVFGRKSRFDLSNQVWMYRKLQEGPAKCTAEYVWTRDRWWDPKSDGTSVAGSGNWTSTGGMGGSGVSAPRDHPNLDSFVERCKEGSDFSWDSISAEPEKLLRLR